MLKVSYKSDYGSSQYRKTGSTRKESLENAQRNEHSADIGDLELCHNCIYNAFLRPPVSVRELEYLLFEIPSI